jgi:hypothetical protein
MPAPKNLSTALAIANTVLTMRDEEFEESEQNVRAVIEEVGKLMQGLVDNACDLEPETRQRLEMMAFVARNNRSVTRTMASAASAAMVARVLISDSLQWSPPAHCRVVTVYQQDRWVQLHGHQR